MLVLYWGYSCTYSNASSFLGGPMRGGGRGGAVGHGAGRGGKYNDQYSNTEPEFVNV